MNKEEIRKVLEIIREPITVNCKDYYYFDNENYGKLLNVYENCLWFINNFEQINETVEILQQQNQQLHERIDKAIEVINKMIHQGYINDNIQYFATSEKSEFGIRANVILEILKGDVNE